MPSQHGGWEVGAGNGWFGETHILLPKVESWFLDKGRN